MHVPETNEIDGFSLEVFAAKTRDREDILAESGIKLEHVESDCWMVCVECTGTNPLWPKATLDIIYVVRRKSSNKLPPCNPVDTMLLLADDSPTLFRLAVTDFGSDVHGVYLVAECESPLSSDGLVQHGMIVTPTETNSMSLQ